MAQVPVGATSSLACLQVPNRLRLHPWQNLTRTQRTLHSLQLRQQGPFLTFGGPVLPPLSSHRRSRAKAGLLLVSPFDVTSTADEEPVEQRFQSFIDEVRAELRVGTFMEQAGELPPRVDNPTLYDLPLRAGNNSQVTLRLRTDDLYVVGFRNAAGQWFEFQHDNNIPCMIHGALHLPFNGSYQRGLSPVSEARVGWQSIEDAIHRLARNVEPSDECRRYLRTLIVSFVESIRFIPIAQRVGAHDELTGSQQDLIKKWRKLSSELILAAIYNVARARQLLAVLAMVYRTNRDSRRRRYKRDAAVVSQQDDDDDDVAAAGLTLVELLGVLIKNIDKENPGDLYGTVSLTNSDGTVTFFNRDRQKRQSVGPGGWADLTWPSSSGGISGADDFFIDVDLKDRDRDLSPDDEVARGQVFWNSGDALTTEFDTVQTKDVRGKYGWVQVSYVVLTDAVVATVKVVVDDGDGEAVPDIYGTVTAEITTTAAWPHETVRYKLLDKPRDADVPVRQGAAIPLQRNAVSVPLGSKLRVVADLWDADRDLSPDDQVAQGSVDFTPLLHGADSATIQGLYGKVTVQVAWSASYASSM